MKTGECVFELPEETSPRDVVSAVVPNARPVQYRFCTKVSASEIELFSINERRRLGEIQIDGHIELGVVSSDGRTMAIRLNGGPVVLFDAGSGVPQGQIDPPDGLKAESIAIDSRSSQLAVSYVRSNRRSDARPVLVVYSLPELKETASYSDADGSKVQFTPDGQKLVFHNGKGIEFRRLNDGKVTAVVDKVEYPPFELSHDGRLLFCELDEGVRNTETCVIGAFETSTGQLVHRFPVDKTSRQHEYSPSTIRVSPDGSMLAALIYGHIFWWPIPAELAAPLPAQPTADSDAIVLGRGIVAEPVSVPLLRHRKLDLYPTRPAFLNSDARHFTSIDRDSGHRRANGRFVDALTIHQWDSLTGRSIDKVLDGGPAGLPKLSSHDGRIWLAHDHGIDFWDAERLELLASHPNGQTGAKVVALAADGSFALAAQDNGVIVRHDVVGRSIESRILTTDLPARHIAISHDNRQAVVVLDSGGEFEVLIFDLNVPSERRPLTEVPRINDCTEIMFSPDGEHIVMTDSDEDTLVAWSAATGETVQSRELYDIGYGLDVSPNGQQIATLGKDETGRFIALWDLDSGQLLARLQSLQEHYVPWIRFSKDGRHLMALNTEGYYTWDISGLNDGTSSDLYLSVARAEPAPTSSDESAAEAETAALCLELDFDLKTISFTPEDSILAGDGQRIDLSTGTRTVYIPDIDLGRKLIWQSHSGDHLVWVENQKPNHKSPRKRLTPQLARWSADAADYWTTSLGLPLSPSERKRLLASHTHYVDCGDFNAVDASVEQHRVATVQSDGSLLLWDVGRAIRPESYREYGRGNAECSVAELAEGILSAAFLPGRDVIVAADAGGLNAFATGTKQSLGSISGPKGPIFQIQFDHSGSRMATFGTGGLELWQLNFDAATPEAKRVAEIASADNAITVFRFSPDDSMLAFSSEIEPPALFDIRTERLISRCAGTGFGARDLAFSADGRQLAAACNDGKSRLWRLRK